MLICPDGETVEKRAKLQKYFAFSDIASAR
jgi:hypothetical protein